MSRTHSKLLLTIVYIIFSNAIVSNQLQAQVINWVFLDSTIIEGSCTSNSSYALGEICYGIEYTPSITGTVTSYTFGFLIDCLGNELQPLSSTSCTMNDNSEITDACSGNEVVLLQSSGNDGNLPVTANQPIILHQVCMNFHFLDSLNIIKDPATGLTLSLDTPSGPFTDELLFSDFVANYSVFGIYACKDTNVCSIILGTNDGKVKVDTTIAGTIVDGKIGHHIHKVLILQMSIINCAE